MPTCSVKHCLARKATNPGLTLHRVPTNKIMKKKWLDIVGIENFNSTVKQWRVCSMHFEESCINRTLGVPRLKDGAVPSSSLLPKPIDSSMQSTPNIMGSEKTTSCDAQDGPRSPSPVQSHMSDDSSPEDSQVEEAINPSGWAAAYTTFAEAWSPIMDPPAPIPKSYSKTVDSPAPTATGPSTNKRNSQDYLHTITIHKQNNKIKNLTNRCQVYKRKIKCLYAKIRTRDRRITQLTYVIKKLKENICFNNEGAIILEESEVPEDVAEYFDDQIPYFEHSTSSSTVSTSKKRSVSRCSDAPSPLPSCATKPDPPPSAPSPTQLPFSVITTNALKSRMSTNYSKEAASKELMLVISPLTINKKTRKSHTRTVLNKKIKPKEMKGKVSPLTKRKTLKRQIDTDLTKEITPKHSKPTIPPSTNKKTLKPRESTDLIKETKSKEMKVKVSPLTTKKTLKSHDNTDLTKEITSKHKKTLKLHDNTDLTKEISSKHSMLTTPPSTNRKILNLYDSTDLTKEITSKRSTLAIPPSTNRKTLKRHNSTDLSKEITSKHSMHTIPPSTNRKILNLYDSTDLTKVITSKRSTLAIPPSTNRKKLKLQDDTIVTKEITSKDSTITIPPLTNENTLKPHEITDLIRETFSKDMTTDNSSGTNKNEFIYIIEVE